MSKALKYFMKANFDFSTLKKVGFYPKEMKHTDYEGQAARVCQFFGFKSVYEYNDFGEIRCHISYASDETGMGSERPMSIDDKGNLKTLPFVEVFNKNSLGI